MSYQERIITATEETYDALFRTARAVPADKMEWKPLDNGRTVLSQLQECANLPRFIEMVLQMRAVPPMTEADMQRAREAGLAWTTLEECESKSREHLAALYEAIRAFPDSELDKTVTLPFGGGMTKSFAQMLQIPYENAMYHLGQINYIQTLYGDFERH